MLRAAWSKNAGSYHSGWGDRRYLQFQERRIAGSAEATSLCMGKIERSNNSMADFEGKTFSEGTVEYTIHEHIAVLERYEGREVPWTKEINVVSWNGGEPKIDIRDWSESHERMSRGITLTEEQTMEMTKALVRRYRARAEHNLNDQTRDDMTR